MRRPYCAPERLCKDESPDLGRSPFFSGLALRCRELEQALNALDDTSRAAVHTLRFMQETFA